MAERKLLLEMWPAVTSLQYHDVQESFEDVRIEATIRRRILSNKERVNQKA
jgi:hypothetical protein